MSGIYKHAISDPSGNNDGMLNPGETAGITLWLKNFGTDTAKAVSAKLRTGDAYISFTDSSESYGDIAPGDSIGILGYSLNVSACRAGQPQRPVHGGMPGQPGFGLAIGLQPVDKSPGAGL